MALLNTPDNATSKIRVGYEATCGVPASSAVRLAEPQFQSSDLDQENQQVENTNIVSTGHAAKAIPGKGAVTGSVASQNDADGILPFVASGLKKASATTALGNGAYRTTYSRSQSNDVPTYTVEQDRGDDNIDQNVGCATISWNLAVANGAAMTTTAAIEGVYQSVWGEVAERHPNPATGSIHMRGMPEEWLDRPSGSAGTAAVQLVDLYTDSDSVEHAIFLARMGDTSILTGTWTVGAASDSFAGSGGAADTELVSGDVIGVEGQLLEVDVITDANTFTTTTNHTAGATAATLTREYGTEAQGSIFFTDVRPGLSSQTSLPRWNTITASQGSRMGNLSTSGDRNELYLTATTGIVTETAANLVGTVSVAASDATVTGSGTAFLSACRIGDYIKTPGAAAKRILSIASDTSMEADSNYDAVESGVTMSHRAAPHVDLTGTITTAATSNAVVGVGTAFDTELAVGSLLRTAGGVVRRVATITDATNLTVDYDYTGVEAGVAATTAYEWSVLNVRDDWVAVTHASGPFPEQLAELQIAFSSSSIPEEEVEIGQDVTIDWTAGRAAKGGIGNKYNALVQDAGSSTATATVTFTKVNTDLRRAILNQEIIRFRVIASTGVTISTSIHEYTWQLIFHLQPTGKPTTIPDATTNNDAITGALFDEPTDADGYTDALTLIVTSDDATPLATS